MEYEKDVLIRNRDTVAQRGLSSAERQKNVEGAFSANPSKMLKITGKSILLIDDIYTRELLPGNAAESSEKQERGIFISRLF